ncbi:hypothetical protein MJL48_35340, partial [Salmonella enterica subsp. enterica serovar Kentucky]|nr:hypothetical protein [Salmonella enterica subsp. enterica serovar Kentucky]
PAPKIRVSGALSTPLTPVSLNYPQQAFDAAFFPVEENAVIAQMIERFMLTEVEDTLPASLPLGIRQRLSLAVAVIHRPEML